MGILSNIVKVARILFKEDQFVEDDSRESLKEAIVRSGMSVKDGSELIQQHDLSGNFGKKFSRRQDDDITITPADKTDLEQDQTVERIKDGVKAVGKYDENSKHVRDAGGKDRIK